MQWMSLIDGNQCLHLSGRDTDFYASALLVWGNHEDKGALTLGIDRFAFVKTNENWEAPSSILMLYTGTWHKGADEYVKWCSTWRTKHAIPSWIENMQGYFLVINKQQYGDEMAINRGLTV